MWRGEAGVEAELDALDRHEEQERGAVDGGGAGAGRARGGGVGEDVRHPGAEAVVGELAEEEGEHLGAELADVPEAVAKDGGEVIEDGGEVGDDEAEEELEEVREAGERLLELFRVLGAEKAQ